MTQAIVFGSLGVLAETAELHRQAYNTAFAEAGLDWNWSAPDFIDLSDGTRGPERIRRFAAATGQSVDPATLEAAKHQHFQQTIARGVPLRKGVAKVVRAALGLSVPLALATTTSRATIDALLAALHGEDVHEGIFNAIMDDSLITADKPDPQVYTRLLRRLKLPPEDVIAIEDTPEGTEAALAADIPTIAFPGLAYRTRTFPEAEAQVEALTPELFGLGRAVGDDSLKSAVA